MGSKRKQILGKAANIAFGFCQRWFLNRDIAAVERRGAKLGALAFRLDKKHRRRTLSNLEMAFPEWPPEKRLEVARGVFRHFGLISADFLRSPIRTNEEVVESIEVVGMEHFEAAEAQGKGILMITGHLGNWERAAQWVVSTGRKISVVARDANDSELNDRVMKLREAAGIEVLSRGNSARAILGKLRRNELVAILPDQNSDECFAPFFGKPCGTVLGPAVMHLRTGAALLPSYCVRVGVGRYRVETFPMIDTSGMNGDQVQITAAVNAVLESVIRRYPDQWLWMHDRWKSARQGGLL